LINLFFSLAVIKDKTLEGLTVIRRFAPFVDIFIDQKRSGKSDGRMGRAAKEEVTRKARGIPHPVYDSPCQL
jgi:hypothetical protein